MSQFDLDDWRSDASQNHIVDLLVKISRRKLYPNYMWMLNEFVQDCHHEVNSYIEKSVKQDKPIRSIAGLCKKIVKCQLADFFGKQKRELKLVAKISIDDVPPEKLIANTGDSIAVDLKNHVEQINDLMEQFFQGNELIIARKMNYVSIPELQKLVGLSRSQVYKKIKAVEEKMPEFAKALRQMLETGDAK